MISKCRGTGRATALRGRSARGDSTIITRRELLAAFGAGAFSAVLNGTLRAAPLGTLELLPTFIKLAGSLDERLVVWWVKGRRYGIVGAQATPLFGMEIGRFCRFFRQANGSFMLAMFELNYYTDTATGRLLEKFQNPYTGLVNEVMHVARRPDICHYTATGQYVPADKNRIRRYRGQLDAVSVGIDTIQIESAVSAEMLSPFPRTPGRRINDYMTATGLHSDLQDPRTMSAPAALSYRTVQAWEPWMKMGDRSGHMTGRASGRKLESLAELPLAYLQMARAVHPWLIRDPIETLSVQVENIRNSSPG